MHEVPKDKKEYRFSDETLLKFHEEFKSHVNRCEERFNEGDKQFQQIMDTQLKNTESISLLIEETREIVQLHKDIQGATRLGSSLQKFILWLMKWGAIGSALAVAFTWAIDYISEVFK